MEGLAGKFVPYQCCFPLIGDSDRSDIPSGYTCFALCFLNDLLGINPDFKRIMFNPAWLG